MKKVFRKWWKTVAALVFILLLAFLIRLANLTILPVFADEAIYIRWSQIMHSEPTLRFLPLSDGKQPLFMWVLMVVISRFDDPLIAGRLVSVFAGLGTIIGVFSLSYLIFKSNLAALVSSLIWAISPYAIFFDRMALVDSMLAMFGIWTVFFAIVTVRTLRLDFAMITGFLLGAAHLTKSPSIFFVMMLPVTWLFLKKFDKRHLVKLVGLSIVYYAISFIIYNILRLGPNFQLIASRNFDYVYPVTRLFNNWRDPLISHLGMFWDWLVKLGPWPLVLLVITGVTISFKKYTKELLVIGLWFIVPVLIQAEYGKVFAARFVFFSIPFMVILAGAGFVKRKSISVILLLVFVAASLGSNFHLLTKPAKAALPESERNGYLEEWTSGIGIREVAEFIKLQNSKSPNLQIVVGTEGYFGTLPDGLQMYIEDLPNVNVIGVGVDLKEVPTSLVESKVSGNKTYLVINKSRLLFDPANFGLELIAAYPKEPRKPDTWHYTLKGSQEVLYLFELTGDYAD